LGDESEPIVSDEPILVCVECGRVSTARASGWRALVADEDEVAIYCPGCAAREFDGK
jgi:hypothetical protein